MGASSELERSFVAVRIPYWQVLVAMRVAGVGLDAPAATHDGRRVVSVSTAAYAAGVRVGMRKRGAQEACSELELLGIDVSMEQSMFDEIASAAEQVIARVSIVRPGLLWAQIPKAWGEVTPAQFTDKIEELASALTDAVAVTTGDECVVGVAGSPFAAVLLTGRAEDSRHKSGTLTGDVIISPERTVEFLRSQPITALEQGTGAVGASAGEFAATNDQAAGLVDLLLRLGVQTLGDLLDLTARTLHSRFGEIGLWAYRLASGGKGRNAEVWKPTEPLVVNVPIDPPALRSDAVAFIASPAAETLQTLLRERSLTCAQVRITVVTDEGGQLTRLWQADDSAWGATTARHIVDRVRWQLDGWLTRGANRDSGAGAIRKDSAKEKTPLGQGEDPAVAPVIRLEISAEEVALAPLDQEMLWGGNRGGDQRARRVIDRVQGLLGGGEVYAAVLQGGRTPQDRVQLVPWGQPNDHLRPLAQPWPGSLPAPFPSTVLIPPVLVEVADAQGNPVRIGERLGMSGTPAYLRIADRLHENHGSSQQNERSRWAQNSLPLTQRPVAVTGWAGPWPMVERWWTAGGRRVVYIQAVTERNFGFLLGYHQADWWCEAIYD